MEINSTTELKKLSVNRQKLSKIISSNKTKKQHIYKSGDYEEDHLDLTSIYETRGDYSQSVDMYTSFRLIKRK